MPHVTIWIIACYCLHADLHFKSTRLECGLVIDASSIYLQLFVFFQVCVISSKSLTNPAQTIRHSPISCQTPRSTSGHWELPIAIILQDYSESTCLHVHGCFFSSGKSFAFSDLSKLLYCPSPWGTFPTAVIHGPCTVLGLPSRRTETWFPRCMNSWN